MTEWIQMVSMETRSLEDLETSTQPENEYIRKCDNNKMYIKYVGR